MTSMRPRRSAVLSFLLAAVISVAAGASVQPGTVQSGAGWQPLFDGKSLTNWTATRFFGEGPVTVEDGHIVLAAGNDLTGVTWSGPALPETNYELRLQAMRVQGSDFFAGITFPVDDSFCSLILGGWGGSIVGLSSINGRDASENDTMRSVAFESGRWYNVRIRVTPARIDAWLDDKPIVEQDLKGNAVSTRFEVEPSQPLGIASWRTKAALREIHLRRLDGAKP